MLIKADSGGLLGSCSEMHLNVDARNRPTALCTGTENTKISLVLAMDRASPQMLTPGMGLGPIISIAENVPQSKTLPIRLPGRNPS